MSRPRAKPAKAKVGLIFCEDANDAKALTHISNALRDDLPPLRHCRKPLILIRDQKEAAQRKKNASVVSGVVRAWAEDNDVRIVIAHQDCDSYEPAHQLLSERIRTELAAEGVPNVIGVAPAWEIEAWWFLWPDAVAAVNSKWRKLTRTGNHGLIKDAKEVLRRDLRAPGTRDYEESDSREIAENVRRSGTIDTKRGLSNSFEKFRADLLTLAL